MNNCHCYSPTIHEGCENGQSVSPTPIGGNEHNASNNFKVSSEAVYSISGLPPGASVSIWRDINNWPDDKIAHGLVNGSTVHLCSGYSYYYGDPEGFDETINVCLNFEYYASC